MTRRDIITAPELEPLLELFSVVMVLDSELNIVFASDTLLRYMPSLDTRAPLLEAFKLLRPGSIASFEDLERNLSSLFLLISSDESFAIRGQVINVPSDAGNVFVFCGAPWLFWMNSNHPEVKLGLNDFAPQDVQIDQLFYMSTESRMVEDLERLNEELRHAKRDVEDAQATRSEFFARMSHEMRTPLNGVVAALSLMGEQSLQGQAAELLGLASKSSDNLLQIINYVLDISKLESSYAQAEQFEFDLADLITSVLDIVRARALEKGLELRSRVDSDLSSNYLGDAAGLRQALLNLVINAIKFTDTGVVAVDVAPATMEDGTLRIEVIDTGTGINKQNQKRIFEPFTTLKPSGSDRCQQDTGLGLDIAKRTIQSMGGRIGVSSAVGVGSTFWIELPFPAVEGSRTRLYEAPATVEAIADFKGRVLLVDDNETNRMLGAMILEGMGVAVTPASSGEEAVEIATSRGLDLVLMDISMPGIDGFEATRQIRTRLDGQSLPVVALTAYASSAEKAKSEACGMNGYLTKPIEREKLITALEACLPRRDGEGSKSPGQAAPGDEPTQVDREMLVNLLQQIGRDNLASVIVKFCDEADRRWSALESAGNESDVAREAHTLASTCRSFGLPALADKLSCIERHAKFGAEGEEPPCVMETGRQLTEGLLELKEELARL